MKSVGSVSLLVLWTLLVASNAQGQSLDWAVRAGGTNGDSAEAVGVDAAGNSYVIGTFIAQATFGAGEPNATVLTSAGNPASQDIFVAKYNAGGTLQWARGIGGTDPSSGGAAGNDWGWGIAVDGAGNSYVTGSLASVTSLADFGGTTLTTPGAFAAKYDANGNAIWATSLALFQGGHGVSIDFDIGGNSYVAGYAPFPTLGGSTATVWKLAPGGGILWVRQAAPAVGGGSAGLGISVDVAGNSRVTGKLQGDTFTFGAGESTETDLADLDGATETFIASYDSNGNLNWARQPADIGGSGQSFSRGGISTDGADNLYVVGSGATSLDGTMFLSGLLDCWLARYDVSGILVWGKAVRGNGSPTECHAVSTDFDGNSYLTGYFTTTVTFAQGEANETTLLSLGGFQGGDIFIAKYDPDGGLLWARQAGGDSVTGGTFELGSGIAVDTLGRAYVTGVFSGSTVFGVGEVNESVLTSDGQTDLFVARYASGAAPPPPTLDLDIDQFRVTNRVVVSRGGSVGITLAVRNNGTVNGAADALLVGVQNGTEVYRQTISVFDPVGNGRTTFAFSSFTPATVGDITWTVTIDDQDPDVDIASSATRVVP